MRRLGMYGLSAFVALLICSVSQAAIIAQFTGTTPSGSNTSYNYNLVFSTNNALDRLDAGSGTLNPGVIGSADFITLNDIGLGTGPNANLVSVTPGAGFTASLQNLGINAAQTSPVDDPLLSNVTFTYTGPATSTDTVYPGFSIVVNNNDGTTLKQFTGQYTDNAGPELDTKVGEIGMVAVPRTGTLIPEPGAVAMGLMSMLGLMARRRK